MPTRNGRARGLAETADTARPRLARLRGLVTVTVTVALICTAPAFAGGCKTGVRTGSEMVIGERKRPPAGMLTPAQAARRVGVAENVLRGELQAGRLNAHVIAGHWWIDPYDLETWQMNRTERATTSSQTPTGTNRELSGRTGTNRNEDEDAGRVTFPPMSAAAVDDGPEFLTMQEAARLARSTTKAIHEWRHEGLLGDYGTPGKRLIKAAELRALLEHGPSKTPPR